MGKRTRDPAAVMGVGPRTVPAERQLWVAVDLLRQAATALDEVRRRMAQLLQYLAPARRCANPKCGEWYVSRNQRRRYCTPECRAEVDRAKKRQWWAARRGKGAKQDGKR